MRKLEKQVIRFPAQVGSWKVHPSSYSLDGLLSVVRLSIQQAIASADRPGILLSGGVDSAVLATIANEKDSVPCFTIGSSLEHPDVISASRLAVENGWDLRIYIPGAGAIADANRRFSAFPGDGGVYLALDFLSHFASDAIAGDGIDEQMGGYWWHSNRNDEFPSIELAFQHFWSVLDSNHLAPMFESAKCVGVSIYWAYLYPEVIDYISRIPLDDRVSGGSKSLWKDLARLVGVPEYTINRKKMGFVNALVGGTMKKR